MALFMILSMTWRILISSPFNTDGIFSSNYFNQWLKKNNNKIIKYGECVGFKVPLSLGGKDELDNLEEIDMDVYWTITLDINNAVKGE